MSRELMFENDRVICWKTTITPNAPLKMVRLLHTSQRHHLSAWLPPWLLHAPPCCFTPCFTRALLAPRGTRRKQVIHGVR
jgi:hypothetical protein